MSTRDQIVSSFLDALSAYGVQPSDTSRIEVDGNWHRLHIDGDRGRSENLSYRIFNDDRPAGFFEDHKRGFSGTFSVRNGADRTPVTDEQRAEWEALRRRRDLEQATAYADAAERAAKFLVKCKADPALHPYLQRKRLQPSKGMCATDDGLLIIPVYSDFDRLASYQSINADGDKLFMPGGRMQGAFHPIIGADKRRVLVCEGWATGAVLRRATGHSVACAMSAGNLSAVVVAMRAKFPGREIVAAVDNDHETEARTGKNPGVEAGVASGARVFVPRFLTTDAAGRTDWHDFSMLYSDEAIVAELENPEPAGPEPETEGVISNAGSETQSGAVTSPAAAPDEPVAGVFEPVDEPARPNPQVINGAVQRMLDDIRHELTEVIDADSGDLPATYSEDNVALTFSRKFADDLRYVSAWGRWMRWSGDRWIHDDSLMAFDLARKICRGVAASARMDADMTPKQQDAVAHRYGQAVTVAAIERLARADRRHAATTEQWDADPWALNTPAGVVDLRTGTVRAPKRDDHMTKITSCAPGGDCPTWRRFLEVATAGDRDLQGFLQRMAGYSLTGSTRDHALFFVYGPGGNGKGTFLNTVTRILGDYAKVAGMEVFTETRGERHPTELAALRGARLVSAQETEEGKRWNESRIKALTGGDPITARFMRMDEFTFQPQFKLVIAGNHKPGLRNVDEAMKRRLHLIPFDVTIRPEDRDTRLPERLLAEAGGILQWMIDGCRDWQEHGLKPPARVQAATAEYLETEDQMAAWMGECCVVGGDARGKSSKLYESYRAWAERAGEFALPQKRWLQQMVGRGLAPKKIGGVMTVVGLGLQEVDHGYQDRWGG